MELIAGWEAGKFIIVVTEGDQIKHRISVTPEELKDLVNVACAGKARPVVINPKHEQIA